MPVKQKTYPNKGIWLDPRTITSVKMPESLCIYKGRLYYAFRFLLKKGYCEYEDIGKHKDTISNLIPSNIARDKYLSSHSFKTEEYYLEFFRTSEYNYKVYALKILY